MKSNDLKIVLLALAKPLTLECVVCGKAFTANVTAEKGRWDIAISKGGNRFVVEAYDSRSVMTILAMHVADHKGGCNLHLLDQIVAMIQAGEQFGFQRDLEGRVEAQYCGYCIIGLPGNSTIWVKKDDIPVMSVWAPGYSEQMLANIC